MDFNTSIGRGRESKSTNNFAEKKKIYEHKKHRTDWVVHPRDILFGKQSNTSILK